jgi:hypothetical protein
MSGKALGAYSLFQQAHLALVRDTEKDSKGNMLTRAGLILLYAMWDAQLAVVSEWKMRKVPD